MKKIHEMHEAYPLSLTRGRAPEDQFDPRWCVRVCQRCHQALTAHETELWFTSLHHGANHRVMAAKTQPPDTWSAEDVWRVATAAAV